MLCNVRRARYKINCTKRAKKEKEKEIEIEIEEQKNKIKEKKDGIYKTK